MDVSPHRAAEVGSQRMLPCTCFVCVCDFYVLHMLLLIGVSRSKDDINQAACACISRHSHVCAYHKHIKTLVCAYTLTESQETHIELFGPVLKHYLYTYIHTRMHAHTSVLTHAYIHRQVSVQHAFMHKCLHTYMQKFKPYAQEHTHTHTYMETVFCKNDKTHCAPLTHLFCTFAGHCKFSRCYTFYLCTMTWARQCKRSTTLQTWGPACIWWTRIF